MEYTVPIPASALAGDIIFVAIIGPAVTPPAGWTAQSGAVAAVNWGVWRKILASSDLGTIVNFNLGSNALTAALVLIVTGTTGIDGIGAPATTASGISLAANSVNPSGSTDLLLCLYLVAKTRADIVLPAGLTPVLNANGLRDTQCVNGHIQVAADVAANGGLCPIDTAPISASVLGAPSIAIGSKALTSGAPTGRQTASWSAAAPAVALAVTFLGASPSVSFAAVTTQ